MHIITNERPPDKQENGNIFYFIQGVQWLSGRVLDSRLRGRGFKPHRGSLRCVLEQEH